MGDPGWLLGSQRTFRVGKKLEVVSLSYPLGRPGSRAPEAGAPVSAAKRRDWFASLRPWGALLWAL